MLVCGSASNGKSSFFEKILQSVLVKKEREAANKASPELAVWKGVRILYSSEPNSSYEKLNSGILKQLTGNEAILYRKLFENEIRSITPQYSMHIMCNNPPEVDGVDQGIIRRIYAR
jgi:phage/plasmid-associated DNA primase